LITSQREHRCPYDRKRKDSGSKSECDDAHPALLKLSRRAGEEKDCGDQNSIRDAATGSTHFFFSGAFCEAQSADQIAFSPGQTWLLSSAR
jgi:hypothetical protein